ncbi:F-box/LRR-repeat protein 17-like isoform X1 [Haliotis rufescens]|uniref:F-box/LRR-repeat protein 17-like isoform X1 n=1 Tax=Haliotis rufescens TaxID=6454 RepID=UPI00201FA4B7|nr:F-box/LRR-repeat protein 17-like isoform X1 [Haliotis rufescens]
MDSGERGGRRLDTDTCMDVADEEAGPSQGIPVGGVRCDTCTLGGDMDAVPCETCPCKKMRRGSGPSRRRSSSDNENEGEGRPQHTGQDPVKIGRSGIYALAQSENSNLLNKSVSASPPCIQRKQKSEPTMKTSPRKSYEDDTQHLSSFSRLLDRGGAGDSNMNCNYGNKNTASHISSSTVCIPSTSRAYTDYAVAMQTQVSCFHGDSDEDASQILPLSLVVNIFQYLSMPDLLCRVCRVCKLWHQAAHDPSLWRHIYLPVSSRVTDSILNWLTSLSDRVLTLDVSDSKLTTFTDEGVMQILQKCRHIRTLKLARYFVFSDDVFESVGKFCHLVRHLNLDGCFSISDKSIVAIGNGCPQLEHLFMSQCNRISDEGMLAVANGCPRLRQLRIDQCVKVKDVSVKALVAGCPLLEYLHLLACSLTDDGLQQLAKLPRLRMLDISNMTQLSSGCLENIARSCKELEVLSVSLNRTVDDECIKTIVLSCIHLKCLSCVACNLTDKTLEYIGRYSKTVERVDVAWCGEITDDGVRAISETCKSLRYLGLMRCGQVTMETVDELIPLYPQIHYSNFVLESRKLLQRARNDGHPVPLHFLS